MFLCFEHMTSQKLRAAIVLNLVEEKKNAKHQMNGIRTLSCILFQIDKMKCEHQTIVSFDTQILSTNSHTRNNTRTFNVVYIFMQHVSNILCVCALFFVFLNSFH